MFLGLFCTRFLDQFWDQFDTKMLIFGDIFWCRVWSGPVLSYRVRSCLAPQEKAYKTKQKQQKQRQNKTRQHSFLLYVKNVDIEFHTVKPMVLDRFALSCLVLFCLVLPFFALSGLVLFCLVLSCLVMSCPVMSCHVLCSQVTKTTKKVTKTGQDKDKTRHVKKGPKQ